jgi:hypothetical protein
MSVNPCNPRCLRQSVRELGGLALIVNDDSDSRLDLEQVVIERQGLRCRSEELVMLGLSLVAVLDAVVIQVQLILVSLTKLLDDALSFSEYLVVMMSSD